jgi:hypothetical protein
MPAVAAPIRSAPSPVFGGPPLGASDLHSSGTHAIGASILVGEANEGAIAQRLPSNWVCLHHGAPTGI